MQVSLEKLLAAAVVAETGANLFCWKENFEGKGNSHFLEEPIRIIYRL